ncbi:uncharacterized protein LOC110860121 [Folsomia candida]|uniref:Uncharacterized protein n=1 Tax=Folsomia candida TaxID=158441 RepID=A0A226D945_FOLCA|nr:uncharacterized protein LOC110860121 [Folsomia candida]XP_021964876.1 uncharacterized protein LOC110860121 [Folsomia candida]OXA41374.1 hypothetical protein Fcan01_23758 [Folsomia candida]
MGLTTGLLVFVTGCALVTLATASSSPDTMEVQYFNVSVYNLPNRDTMPGDLSDPYVIIRNGAGVRVYESGYYENRVNATFYGVNFNVVPNERYEIDFRDHDDISGDEACGSVYVQGDNLVGDIHRLSNPTGGLVVFRWRSVTDPPTTTTEMTTTTTPTTTTPTTTTPTTTTTSCPCCTREYIMSQCASF